MGDYRSFVIRRMSFEANTGKDIIEIPEGVYSELNYLYDIMVSMQDNKTARKDIEKKIDDLQSEIQDTINTRKSEVSQKSILEDEKSKIFEETLKDNQDIDEQIKKLDEQIQILDQSIASKENSIIQKKQELIKVKSDLVVQKENEAKQNLQEKYQQTKQALKEKSDKVINTPQTDFEAADKNKANQMVQEAVVYAGEYNISDINEIKDFNSTSVMARTYQAQAKFERKAAKCAQEVLQKISSKTLSIKEFGEEIHKYKESFELLDMLNEAYNRVMLQQDYLFGRKSSDYSNKFATIMENDVISKDYVAVDKLLESVDKNLDSKIEPEEFDKQLDDFDRYASDTHADVPKNNFVSKILHGKSGAKGFIFYDNRFKSLEMVKSSMPKAKLPVVQKENNKFRHSLKILENERVSSVALKDKQPQGKEDSIER